MGAACTAQGVLEASVFEPGPWRSTTCPTEVPKARQCSVCTGPRVPQLLDILVVGWFYYLTYTNRYDHVARTNSERSFYYTNLYDHVNQ